MEEIWEHTKPKRKQKRDYSKLNISSTVKVVKFPA